MISSGEAGAGKQLVNQLVRKLTPLSRITFRYILDDLHLLAIDTYQ